jgi:hypothetical protein
MTSGIGIRDGFRRFPPLSTSQTRLVRAWLLLLLLLLLTLSSPSSKLGSSSESDLGIALQGNEWCPILGRPLGKTIRWARRSVWRRLVRGVLGLVPLLGGRLFSSSLVQRVSDFGSAFQDAPL